MSGVPDPAKSTGETALRTALIKPLRKAAKAWLRQVRAAWVRAFRSYGPAELRQALTELGIQQGDAVLLHAGFSELDGFSGTIDELTSTFLDAVGDQGHLLMVSLPYRDASYAYLQRIKRFDVRRTPSMMGMVSELFRRRSDVLRSLHPTHPILVHGPRAHWFVDEHPRCVHPCGPGTPFERLLEVDGKVVFFNVSVATYTFFHYIEHVVADQLPFAVYTDQVFEVPVVGADGQMGVVRTHAFDPGAIARRRFPIFESELRRRGLLRTVRVGASTLEMVRVRDSVDCALDMMREGRHFYDMSPPSGGSALRSDP